MAMTGNDLELILEFIKMLGGTKSISNNWQTHTLVTFKVMTSFVARQISVKVIFLLFQTTSAP